MRRQRLLAVAALLAAAATASAQGPTTSPWTQRLADHLDMARERTLAACKQRQIELPADFLAWVDGDPVRRTSVWGCRKDPLPVLLALRSLELDLGSDLVRRDHPQLALAFALQGSYQKPRGAASNWNDGDVDGSNEALPDVRPRPPIALVIPGDPRQPVDTKDPNRPLDRDDHIVNFLEDHAEIEADLKVKELPAIEYDDKGTAKPRGKAVTVVKKVPRKPVAADVIASQALQAEFQAYMAAHGHPDVKVDCGERAVHWYSEAAIGDGALRERIKQAHELFHAAYKAKGRLPKERDAAPTSAESMAWFVRNDRHAFADAEQKARAWPLFPLDAPWPVLLMLAADDQPLREREDIWLRFRDHGEMQTYGEYIGGIAQQFDMQSARRLSPLAFTYGSIQMMGKDGGVCGTMGNIGARTYRICGVPASTAGQPGHCALVRMERDAATGKLRCVGGQYATGGDEVTTVHAGWNFDDKGGRRPMVFWQSIAWGCNHGVASLVDTLALCRTLATLPPATQAKECVGFVADALARNPFALAAVEAGIAAAPDAAAAIAVLDTFDRATLATTDGKEHALYRSTVRDLAHARVLQLPEPAGRAASEKLLGELERQGCADGKLLARVWRAIDGEAGFTRRCRDEVKTWLESPGRARDKRTAQTFAARVKAWGQTVQGKAAKAAWASELLADFAGKEVLEHKGKKSIDPAVEVLCKLADREPPKVEPAR